MLLRPPSELAATDMAQHAIDALQESTIKMVDVVGRRGPAQAAWTTAELREIVNVNCNVVMEKDELTLDEVDSQVCLSVCLSVFLSVYCNVVIDKDELTLDEVDSQVCLSACLSACLSVCLSVYLSICLSICLPVCLSVCLSVRPCTAIFVAEKG